MFGILYGINVGIIYTSFDIVYTSTPNPEASQHLQIKCIIKGQFKKYFKGTFLMENLQYLKVIIK